MAFIDSVYALLLQKATVIHEIMHAIGMQHEHQRTDRDKYIEMLWDNIRQGKQNENMKLEKTKDTNPYDIESLLQYGLFSFKKTRGYTMRARDKNLEFLPDTANGLTFYDVMDITSGYQCTKNCKTKPNCIHGGFVGHRCKCMCPSGTKGATCQHIDSDCGKIIHLKSGESEVITSPNYPNTYGVDKECVWLVKNVDGTKIHLDFEDLHLPKNPGNNRCHHWLEVRYNLIGQTGPKRCGSITSTASAASLISNDNLMMLKLNSRFAKDKAPAKGFKVKVTAEGQGKVNYLLPVGVHIVYSKCKRQQLLQLDS
ncbi:hypothetical protein FSP39_022298 [Pinctada imbricata]|uniref:Metalloendopeptidase n=1 Tax=Pinctada imbricata TaxID=66713 RepID=A0AA88XWW1_PINIB|nr:hypothetical protein FSP39_022298 [Pinctada imbricata]